MLEETQLIEKGYLWDDVEQWWVREWTTNNGAESILEAYREDVEGSWWNIMVDYSRYIFYEEKVMDS